MRTISLESLHGLRRTDQGLTDQEISFQKNKYGKNIIVETPGNQWIEVAKETTRDPMIWFLLGVGGLFFLIGQRSEGFILFLAILPLLLMDAFLHWRTGASTRSLKSNLSSESIVVRGGKQLVIDSIDLVPGDLVKLTTGSILPADGILESAVDLRIDESVLTGEAFPVKKQTCHFNWAEKTEKTEISIQSNEFVSAGTRVLTGNGSLRVLAIGGATSYGEIVKSISSAPSERTPLQLGIASLTKNLVYLASAFCLFLAGVRIYQGFGWMDALLSAATLAVAAIPEEFPLVFSFFLGVGVYRLAQHQALVRRAVSVENIGRVSWVCTDKTGTITVGELELSHMDPVGSLTETEFLKLAMLPSNPEGTDPIDVAIFRKGSEFQLPVVVAKKRFPYTEDRKRETALVAAGGVWSFVTKGAPESILLMCQISDLERRQWEARVSKWAQSGHKVLACARSFVVDEKSDVEPSSGFEMCGLLAFEDPARPEVLGALSYCYKNDIRVLMITGDHPDTAMAVAKEVGMGHKGLPQVISAESNLDHFTEDYLNKNPEFLKKWDVVARCTPLQKLRIVSAIKKLGEIVAVTGDGVNDAPALKAADIGIAMGQRGTRSAKEVSSIILADDNFSTIVSAVKEGRQLFKNLKSSFEYLLLMHMPFVLTAALLPLFGYPLLYLPVHVVWLELIIHPTAILAFQMDRDSSPSKQNKNFFDRGDVIRLLLPSLVLTFLISLGYIMSVQAGDAVNHSRAKALAVLIMWSFVLNSYYTKLKTRMALAVAILTMGISVILIQTSAASEVLQISTLQLMDWLEIVGIVLLSWLVLAYRKTNMWSELR